MRLPIRDLSARIHALGICSAVALLAGCGGAASTPNGLAPSANSGEPLNALPTQRHGREHPQIRYAIKLVAIPGNSCCIIAVDRTIGQIYVSSGVNLSGNHTTVVDAKTFSVVAHVRRFGGANNVDTKTDNVWLAGLYSGHVNVYSGRTRSSITRVSLGFCPISSWMDSKRRYAWIAAQCGSGNDPVWAINADTYKVVAGPIGTGGVMNPTNPVNPVTGRFYGNNSAGNFEIDPSTFKLSSTSFGFALNVNPLTNLIYAQINDGLNIVAGATEKIKKKVSLPYTPGFVGVDESLNHIYIGAGQNVIEVREGNTGNLLGTVNLPSGVAVNRVGAAYTGSVGHIYAVGVTSSGDYLYDLHDSY